jgi:hypothetical protein
MLEKLKKVYTEEPNPEVIFDWNSFIEDSESNIIEIAINISSVEDLFTSMTFPLNNPGRLKDVKEDQIWIGKDSKKREFIIEGLIKGTLKRHLILAKFSGGLFLLDGQKRARAIFETIRDNIQIKAINYPALILEHSQISKFSDDLMLY